MIIWFTGISGVGKSTLSERFFNKIKFKYKNTIFIDGDKSRQLLGMI
jgi:adenylylsulfate kinase-like enzyme